MKKKKWTKKIYWFRLLGISILLSNHLKLGFSFVKNPIDSSYHLNIYTCQIHFVNIFKMTREQYLWYKPLWFLGLQIKLEDWINRN